MKNSEIEATGVLKDEVLSEDRERVPREERTVVREEWRTGTVQEFLGLTDEETALVKIRVLESAVVIAAIAWRRSEHIHGEGEALWEFEADIRDAVDALIKARDESK